MKINTATKITILRVLLIPIILLVLLVLAPNSVEFVGHNFYIPYLIALIIYIVASVSDTVDGHIARSTNTITNLGKFLDPVADKLLVNTLLIYFTATGHIPPLVTILMIGRDTMVDALRMISVENNVVIAASKYGKLKTIFQMVSLGLILIFAYPGIELPNLLNYLIYLTTIISVFSGLDYFIKNKDSLLK
ncbi:CDP-diacylglycerol--glycerol-3-phosphate 3-phosphatidyltransferase [Mycoplasma sp. P36-A1]|uniref:CDP-diacylglycerol--glycerol-3-phosphate 3-phosphatidyltransferase n=1 Tax=Mycoplasma sp. P36-A1 TaxID=3252900 RepID=UPI003C2FBA29